LAKKNEWLKNLSNHVTTLEIELVKAKEQMGDAMNTVNELEGMEMP